MTANDADLADRVGVERNLGSHAKYVNEMKGCKSYVDPAHAAALKAAINA
jgi:hypothetical protein